MIKRKTPTSRPFVRQTLILSLLLIALAIRLYEVSSVPLNVDEISTVLKYAALPVIDILRDHHSNNHPLASLLAHLFSPRTDHLFMMRWPFILIGFLSLPFVYRLATDLLGQKTGILALLLVSLAPAHIGYSVTIRGYIGLIALTTLSLYLLWRGLQFNRWRDWGGFVGVNLLLIYFHLFGLLGAGAQLLLVGGWLFWHVYRGKAELTLLARGKLWQVDRAGLHRRGVKFSWVIAVLGLLYPLLIYSRANAIMSTERWSSDFGAWQNTSFSLAEDLAPVTSFVTLLGPLSPAGVGLYFYLLFAAIGLAAWWGRYRPLAVMTLGWFCLPFGAIFLASQLLGEAFYVFFRFLLYLLPAFLILVASGLAISEERWLALSARVGRHGQIISRAGSLVGLAVLLALLSLSSYWYLLMSTHSDWLGLTRTLSAQLKPEDITLCEEHQRGFVVPDRAKPHCIWMLDFFVPQLRGQTYSPRFQSTTDFVANYEHLRAQREQVQGPGTIWLIIWQKIPFHPGQFVTDQKPPVLPPPPLAAFAPYQAWHFGSATLVHIASEETLLGNLSKAVELLAQVEPKPADKARYYRSLAEIEAVQGHAQQAQAFFRQSWTMVEQAGGEYPELFLETTQQVVKRLPNFAAPSDRLVELNYAFGSSLCLQGYEISRPVVKAGQALQLKLYWQTLQFIPEDYTFFIRLEAEGQPGQLRVEFQPFDGTYPTPWWWPGQQLSDQREFQLPPELLPLNYAIHLGAYNRQKPDESLTVPLFMIVPQAESEAQPGWRIEPLPSSERQCLQLSQ